MAIQCLRASSESLTGVVPTTLFTGFPLTAAVTMRWISTGYNGYSAGLSEDGDYVPYFGFHFFSPFVRFRARGDTAIASTDGYTIAVGRWHRLVGMSLSATDHRFFIDGRFVSRVTTDIGAVSWTQLNRFCVGNETWASEFTDADFAEAAVWACDIGPDGARRYGEGVPANQILPQNQRLYFPLMADDRCRLSGSALSIVAGTPTWIDHPPMRRMPQRAVRKPAAAAGGFSTALFRDNAGQGAVGGGPFARSNAGVGVLA